ncbi:uncharacterized protein G2W53_003789 [Senna tora]|uniref:Uncharacterized protein n=1 Tax=Senna tora TaxID=362788 RepID=A0A834XAQ2_9FABA|nr:uncharacterized protein G2W53_003789 [Senna tora]
MYSLRLSFLYEYIAVALRSNSICVAYLCITGWRYYEERERIDCVLLGLKSHDATMFRLVSRVDRDMRLKLQLAFMYDASSSSYHYFVKPM